REGRQRKGRRPPCRGTRKLRERDLAASGRRHRLRRGGGRRAGRGRRPRDRVPAPRQPEGCVMSEVGKVLTANRLGDGAVVFLNRAGQWIEAIDEAAVALEKDAQAAFEQRGKEAEARNHVTGTYLFDVE